MERLLKAFWATAVLIWTAAAVAAAPPLTITDSGYYLTILGEDGVPELVLIETVVDLTEGNKPDTPDKEPDVDVALVRQVQGWAESLEDPLTSQAVALVYGHVRGATKDGSLTPASAWTALKQATDSAVGVVASGTDWSTFRDELSVVVTEGRQRGTLQSTATVTRFLRSVQHGLELSADGSDALSLDKAVAIAAKTNEAIDGNQ